MPPLEPEISSTTTMLDLYILPNTTLAVCVVAYRTLGMDKCLAKLCMQELASRRLLGSTFDYEAFIEQEVGKVPVSKNIDTVKIGKDILLGVLQK